MAATVTTVNGMQPGVRKRGAKPKYKFMTAEEAVAHRFPLCLTLRTLHTAPYGSCVHTLIRRLRTPYWLYHVLWKQCEAAFCRRERNRSTAIATHEKKKAREAALRAEV